MIPVNGKPVIGWILEDLIQKGFQDVALVLRFDNTRLFDYVSWAFGQRIHIHFAFVQPGGTILHSLLSGLEMVSSNQGVYIVLGDTLIQDELPAQENFIYAGAFQNPEDWCLVESSSSGLATAYHDKQQEAQEGWQALAGVYNLMDISLLKQTVKEQIHAERNEISSVLTVYGKRHSIAVQRAKHWYDFGHIHYFNLAKQKLLQSRYFNSLTIDSLRGTITKMSLKNEKLEDELNWYKALPASLKIFCPRLEDIQTGNTISIKQEYYGYPNLAELYVFGDLALSVWKHALQRLLEIHTLFKNEEGEVTSNDLLEMYQVKTKKRLEELHDQEGWAKRLTSETISINGQLYRNFKALEGDIETHIKKLCESFKGGIIHGDYCFSNILYDLNTQVVRLIDPRGSFGSQKLFGDPRYDIAKLRHSVVGRYDFILADLFKVDENQGEYTYDIVTPVIYKQLTNYFDTLIRQGGYQPLEIKLIEGLLFISMVPLHRDNPKRQLAMYLSGIQILNEVIDNANSN